MTEYIVTLKNGNTIQINAIEVEWNDEKRFVLFNNEERRIAWFNLDNIAGWSESKYTNTETKTT